MGRLALVLLLAAGLIAAACSAPPGPRGWAPAHSVMVGDRQFVLAPHKSHVYAVRLDSGFVQWQFPPEDRNSYPISQQRLEELKNRIDALDVSADQKDDLNARAEALTVSGNSGDALKDALTAAVGDENVRKPIEDFIDDTRDTEKRALGDVRALYGEIGVSGDASTAYVAAFGGWVFAIETATGQTRWIIEPKDEIVGGTAVDGDRLFFGTKADKVFAVDAATGEQQWVFKTGGEVWSTPTIAGGEIYVTSMDGVLHKLDADGNEQWSFNSAGAGIAGNPTVEANAVYFGSFDKKLYAVNADDGTMKWSVTGDNWFWGQPAVTDGIVYAPNLDGRVYAIRADNGDRAWRFDAGQPVRSSPAVVDGALIVADREGEIYKLDLQSGEQMGDPYDAESRIESNLTTDDNGTVFVVPHDPTLLEINTSEDLTPDNVSSVQLTR
jgi:outer membrane protein assembly factor BamB